MYDLHSLSPIHITRFPGDDSNTKPTGYPEDGDGKPKPGKPKN